MRRQDAKTVMTRHRVVPILLAAIGLTSLIEPAYSQCVVIDKPEELFARSSAVFVGTVVANKATGAEGAHAITNIGTIRLTRSWKGAAAPEIHAGSDMPFEVGKQYIVFASGKPLSTSILCRWAERVETAKHKLDWLSKRPSREPADKRVQPTATGRS